jgi:hypothetical protein
LPARGPDRRQDPAGDRGERDGRADRGAPRRLTGLWLGPARHGAARDCRRSSAASNGARTRGLDERGHADHCRHHRRS